MMNDEMAVMIWLGLSCLLHSSAQENNAELAREGQLDCNPSLNIRCPSVISREGDVIQYVVKRAPIELQNAFRAIPGKSFAHLVCREPECLYHPCLNGATCTDTFEGFNCSCQNGYIGNRCQTSLFIQSVGLHTSQQNTGEGRVVFVAHDFPSKIKLFENDAWTMNTSHLICKYLGYTGALATVSGNVFNLDSPDESQEYGAVRCNETAVNISDCWYEPSESGGVSIDMIIGVVCCTSATCEPDGELLGIRDPDVIPDSAFTESSCHNSERCGSAGRLYSSSSSWIPSDDDLTSPWVQVSFGSLYIITGVVTQSRNQDQQWSHWVTSYTLSSSLDDDQWFQYRDAYTTSGPTVFSGNYEVSSLVEQSLYPPLMARYITIHPRTYSISISLRFELRGFGPLADYISDIFEPNLNCGPLLGDRLGVANRSIIPDSSFSASKPSDYDNLKPSNGRLFGDNAWASNSKYEVGWWKVDLGVSYHVTGVITQGRWLESRHQWVTSYKISLSHDATWINVGEEDCGIWKQFPANYDKISLVTNIFPKPLSGRFVKLYPLTWKVWPTLRCEILGFL